MQYLGANQIAQQIKSGVINSVDITRYYLEKIQTLNPSLNAFVDVFDQQAIVTAKQRDVKFGKSEPHLLGPLHGVPISIKECFGIAGTRSTVNFPPLKQNIANDTSLLVTRLQQAGAVILGKTNVPTLLSDAQTFGPLYPQCNNPHDITRTPGGSTGGGAAALAADMTALELGSDIGGSIRNPAAFCGLYGFKPTENGHFQDGHIPPLPGNTLGWGAMNSTGPLARRADDLTLACDVLFAPDWTEQYYLPITSNKAAPESLNGVRIGVLNSLYGMSPGNDVSKAIEDTKAKLKQAGARVESMQIDKSLSEKLLLNWVSLFGFSMGQTLSWPLRKVFYWRFKTALKDSNLDARNAFKLGLSLNFKAFSRCLAIRKELTQEIHRLYAPYDTVLSATALGPAFPHNHKHQRIELDGESIPYIDYCFPFVALYNLTGMPVLTVPCGTQQGLPIGLSFAASNHSDRYLLALGRLLEQQGVTSPLTNVPAGIR